MAEQFLRIHYREVTYGGKIVISSWRQSEGQETFYWHRQSQKRMHVHSLGTAGHIIAVSLGNVIFQIFQM